MTSSSSTHSPRASIRGQSRPTPTLLGWRWTKQRKPQRATRASPRPAPAARHNNVPTLLLLFLLSLLQNRMAGRLTGPLAQRRRWRRRVRWSQHGGEQAAAGRHSGRAPRRRSPQCWAAYRQGERVQHHRGTLHGEPPAAWALHGRY